MAKLYMAVTKDQYELPIAVAGSAVELAKMVGTSADTVRSLISKNLYNGYKHSPYRRVEVDDDSDELKEVTTLIGAQTMRGRHKHGTH